MKGRTLAFNVLLIAVMSAAVAFMVVSIAAVIVGALAR